MKKSRIWGACAVACLSLVAVACQTPPTGPPNVRPVAIATATPDSGSAPLEVSFSSAGSTDPDGTIASYAWNFGDSATSTSANPTHTYTAVGVYTATLTVTDNRAATATATTTVTVSAVPNQAPLAVAAATPDSGSAPLAVDFSSVGSSDTDGTIVSYAWDFGDGNTSTDADPSHTYAAEGSYPVTLTVTDDDGATGTATVTVTVTPAPDDPNGRYVATTGADTGDCSTSVAPCLTVTYAVGQAVTGNTVYVAAGAYDEMVIVNKSLAFKGANAGVAGSAARGAESIVKGFRNGTVASSPGTTQYDLTIDGFRIDVQGDAALMSASAKPLVWLRGGATGTSVVNNVLSGAAAFVPDCGFTCTTMADYAVIVNTGTVGFSNNFVENFRRPLNFTQSTATPLTLTVSDNTITGVTSRGISFGGATSFVMPGATISGNTIDATGRDLTLSTPAGMVISNGGNQVSGNTLTGLSSGVFINLCKKFSTDNNVVSDNTFAGNGGGINVTTILDTSQCSRGVTEGTDGWVVGGGRANGFQAHGNSFTGQTSYAIRFNPNYGTYTDVVTTGPLDVTCNFYEGGAGPVAPNGIVQGPVTNAQLNATPWQTTQGGACDGGV